MENIKHYFGVDLSTSSIRTLSKKDNGALLYPYKNVVISIHEVHICPFCGKIVQDLYCDCKAFTKAVKKLQDFYGDKDHNSYLHHDDFNISIAISKSISEFKVKKLSKKEISALGPDVWDFATRHSDRFSDKSYLVTPAVQENDLIFLLCKDLNSKVVYRFELSIPEYKDKPIYLGIHKRKTVAGIGDKRKLGNYHFEYYWDNYVKYEDWNDVCKAITKI